MIRQANTLLVVLVTCLLAYGIRFGYSALPAGYVVALLLALLLAAIVVPATGAYRREFEWAFGRKLRRLIAGWAIVILMLVSLAAMLKVTDYYSRIWFGTWVLLCAVGLVAMLLISHAASVRSRKAGRNRRGIVLVGSGESARRVEAQIRSDPLSGLELLACFGEPWSESETRPLDQLAHFIDENRVQGVWIALPWEDKAILERALDMLKAVVVDVNVVPDLHQYRLLNQNISEWGGMPVISLSATPMTDAERRLKAVMDWLGALLLTLLLSPLLLLICLAILLSDGGPALYRQRRLGVGGESIDILKFRTMRSESAAAPFRQASPDDDRVTRVGRFLRRSSLDELPQIFNVLKGEMSLVGPRPHPVELNDEFSQWLSGSDGHPRENGFTDSARPLVHPELVPVARSQDPAGDAVRDDAPQRVLNAQRLGFRQPTLSTT
jgi:putative colanic acid biosynthesis UDP-glucose lipid carrier transferase